MTKRILAVASAGGHWVQLLRLRPAFAGNHVMFVSTSSDVGHQVHPCQFRAVRDASAWDKLGLILMLVQMAMLVARFRPDVVISTGAAPGFFALLLGRLAGARTIWIDSIANAEEMSLAGRKVRHWADHWLTQWPELAAEGGPSFIGAVI